VVVSVGSGTNLTNGVTGNLELRSLIKFWNRRKIVDPTPLIPRVKPIAKVKNKKIEEDSDSEELVVVTSRKKGCKTIT